MKSDYKVWVKRGMMLINTDSLAYDDPDHPYNQIVAQGLRPEDYGMRHPLTKEFGRMTRDRLIEEIVALRKIIDGYDKS